MAEVFICESEQPGVFDGRRAIKVPKSSLRFSPQDALRWISECFTWVRIGAHPNVVQFLRLHLFGSTPQLVLEFVEDSLRDQLLAGALPLDTAVRYAAHVCDAMIHVASSVPDFVHRDLKPENILISNADIAKVTDFGLIRSTTVQAEVDNLISRAPVAMDRKSPLPLRASGRAGTPAYMSPEQIRGARLDTRSDIYSFGCVFHEMLTGRLVFDAMTEEEYYKCHLTTPPPDLRHGRREIPMNLARMIARCLEKDPAQRPSSFRDIREQLTGSPTAIGSTNERRDVDHASDTEEAAFSVADALFKLGAYERARDVCVAFDARGVWRDYYLARIDVEEGKIASGLTRLRGCLARRLQEGERGLVLSALGEALRRQGSYPEAREAYLDASKELPAVAAPLANAAWLSFAIGEKSGAFELYRRALALSYDPQIVGDYCVKLLHEKAYGVVIAELEHALSLFADDLPLRLLIAQAFVGRILLFRQERKALPKSALAEVRLARRYAEECVRRGVMTQPAESIRQIAKGLEALLAGE